MPGLARALRRRRFRNSTAIDNEVVMTGVAHTLNGGLLHIGLHRGVDAVDLYRRVLQSGTSLRFSIARDVVALDLLRGNEVVGRILTSVANTRLAELVRCAELAVLPFTVQDPASRDLEPITFPTTCIEVTLEELYGDPEILGHGRHVSYSFDKISGKWTFHRHTSRAAAKACVEERLATNPPLPTTGFENIVDEVDVPTHAPPSWRTEVLGTPFN